MPRCEPISSTELVSASFVVVRINYVRLLLLSTAGLLSHC